MAGGAEQVGWRVDSGVCLIKALASAETTPFSERRPSDFPESHPRARNDFGSLRAQSVGAARAAGTPPREVRDAYSSSDSARSRPASVPATVSSRAPAARARRPRASPATVGPAQGSISVNAPRGAVVIEPSKPRRVASTKGFTRVAKAFARTAAPVRLALAWAMSRVGPCLSAHAREELEVRAAQVFASRCVSCAKRAAAAPRARDAEASRLLRLDRRGGTDRKRFRLGASPVTSARCASAMARRVAGTPRRPEPRSSREELRRATRRSRRRNREPPSTEPPSARSSLRSRPAEHLDASVAHGPAHLPAAGRAPGTAGTRGARDPRLAVRAGPHSETRSEPPVSGAGSVGPAPSASTGWRFRGAPTRRSSPPEQDVHPLRTGRRSARRRPRLGANSASRSRIDSTTESTPSGTPRCPPFPFFR